MNKKFLKKHISSFQRDITSLGGMPFYLIIILITLSLKEYLLTYKLIFGFIISFIFIALIRTFYFKDRPNKEKYSNYLEKLDASSFPSLHATRSIFLALLLTNTNKLFSLIIIIIALIVVYSRIYIKKHDIIDVFFGSILGFIIYLLTIFFF